MTTRSSTTHLDRFTSSSNLSLSTSSTCILCGGAWGVSSSSPLRRRLLSPHPLRLFPPSSSSFPAEETHFQFRHLEALSWERSRSDKGIISFISMALNKSRSSGHEKALSFSEQQMKINEVRSLIGPLSNKLPSLFSDASISRYLRARNWNTKKASRMLKESLEWRLEYKPEEIRWEEIAHEAETGKIYRANYLDKFGRPVLVMRPGFQNTNSTKGQIRYLVYCMENAIFNLAEGQEQMVWLIDFQDWNMASISVKVTRETAHVLQNHYPERLGLGILYNPPKIFESFWKIVKPFLETKTYKKVKFVYSDNTDSQKIMEDLFDLDKLESAFGGCNPIEFKYNEFEKRMKEDDRKLSTFLTSGNAILPHDQHTVSAPQQLDASVSECKPSEPVLQAGEGTDSEASDEASSPNGVSSPESSVIDRFTKEESRGSVICGHNAISVPDGQIDAGQIK